MLGTMGAACDPARWVAQAPEGGPAGSATAPAPAPAHGLPWCHQAVYFQPLPAPPAPQGSFPASAAAAQAGAAAAAWVVGGHGAAPSPQGAAGPAAAARQDPDGPGGGADGAPAHEGAAARGWLAPSQSLGSARHGSGECRPCAWYYKAQGCSLGGQCDFCHLCLPGEVKNRKKSKVAALRQRT